MQEVEAELATGTRQRMESVEVERTGQLRDDAAKCIISFTDNRELLMDNEAHG